MAIRAPEEKQELAAVLMRSGLLSLGLGIAILAVFWLIRRFTN